MGVIELNGHALLTPRWTVADGEGEGAGAFDSTPRPDSPLLPEPLLGTTPTASPTAATPTPADTPAPQNTPEETAAATAELTPELTATPEIAVPSPLPADGAAYPLWRSSFVWAALAACLALAWIVSAVIRRARRPGKTGPVPGDERAAAKPAAMSIGNLHNIGMRGNQEDSFAISDVSNQALLKKHGLLAVVADGMGGLENGETASVAVTSVFMNAFAELPETLTPPQKLLWLTRLANSEVCRVSSGLAGQSGSTLLAVLVHDGLMWFTSVGDSHICLFRGGAPIRLTREHTYAVDLDLHAAMGGISFAEASDDSQRHALTSYMGMPEPEHIDFNENPIQLLAGDWVVLMSDGVFNTVSEPELATLLYGNVHEASARIEEAVLNKQSAYQDNFTAVLLRIM